MKGKWQNHLCIKSNLEPAVSGKTSKNKISTTMWSTFLLLYCALKKKPLRIRKHIQSKNIQKFQHRERENVYADCRAK